ncbi:GNAT family N-acetyltransferase [Caldibacillus lycopersici]|uniref:GNAT family N-acetyltransferase n=1 Tax=Perspicuibacillus lycopersici TaxID=1325689 RepID=A0AAE3ISD5_9BACI|nr:GNAT family N-acetyltransferase [Perspicuibacillus lycopersici]MCU9613537.1 GNAT family N-acetyltransferase [Perspicuibacillus lycopersici]
MQNSDITYSVNEKVTAEAVATVYKKAGLRRPVDDLDRIGRMLDHADIVITAWSGDQLVGVARAITDYSYCCYLSDLAVDPDFQQQGIGKNLIQQLQQQIGEEVSLILLASAVAMDYYPHIGFEKLNNSYAIGRKR